MGIKNKRGVSTILAWVLLIGFTVTLAIMVMTWAIKVANKIDPSEIADPELYCDNVRLSVENDFIEDCSGPLNSLSVKNKGYRDFTGLILKVTAGGFSSFEYDQEIKVDTLSNPIFLSGNCDISGSIIKQIEIIPKINVTNGEIACEEKVYILKEAVLTTCECP